MKQHVKAIQTRYKGYKFRSRLEARWAVFFDACGEKWIYEPEGFDFSDCNSLSDPELSLRKYLPDFWLPRIQTWIEIKPALPQNCFGFTEEESLVHFLVEETQAREGLVFWGMPDLCTPSSSIRLLPSTPGFRRRYPSDPIRYPSRGICNLSIAIGQEAVDAAKSARFEYGESGAV